MLYLLSALTGAFLFCGGYVLGTKTAPKPELVLTEEADDLAVKANDSKRRQEEKINAQYLNMLNYTGRRQKDDN